MNSKILLRIAAGIMLLHGLVLTISVLLHDYKSYEMPDFILGSSLCGILLALLIAALLWTLSCRKDKSAVKLLWIIATATLLLGIIEIIFFFPYAVCWLPAALTFVALFQLNKIKITE